MKRILVVLFSLICFIGYAQTPYPTPPQQQGGKGVLVANQGGQRVDSTLIPPVYSDTAKANRSKTSLYPGSVIRVGDDYYYRSADTSKWLLLAITTSNCAGTQLVSGSITWSGSGLVYDATDLDYYILCSRYFANSTTLTLAVADPTFPRIDKFYADITGAIGVITGTPATNPQEPQVNPLTQIDLGFVYIPAGSTVPAGTTQTVIYNENVEWSGTSDVPSINFAYATNPYIGSLSTYLPSAPNSSYVEWQSNGIDYLFSEAQYLKFWVRLNADFTVDPLSFLDVTFEYTDVTVSQTLPVGNGDYNMDYSLINQWQLVSIPLTGITTFGASFNSVHFVINSAPTSFQLDYIYLLETATVPPVISSGWALNLNTGTNPTTNGIGTSDSVGVAIKTNSQTRLIVPANGIVELSNDELDQQLLTIRNDTIYKTNIPTAYGTLPIVVEVRNDSTFITCPTCDTTGGKWNLTGNAITSGQFLGTINSQDLVFKRNSTEVGRLSGFNVNFGVNSTTGTSGVGVGYNSGYLSSGINQTFIGFRSGESSTAASGATFIGNQSGVNNTGDEPTGIGYGAASNNTGIYLTSIGRSAGASNSGDSATFVGYLSGYNNSFKKVIGLGMEATPTSDNQLYIASYINSLFLNLDSASGTAPAIAGIDANGNWRKYATPSGGSSQWTDTTAGIYYGNKVAIGGAINPTHTLTIGDSATNQGTVLISVPETDDVFSIYSNAEDEDIIHIDNLSKVIKIGASNYKVGVSTLTPDSNVTVNGGTHLIGGVRASSLPSNQTYSKSLGVTSNGTLYLKDTVAHSVATLTGLGTGVGTFLSTPTYDNLTAAVTTTLDIKLKAYAAMGSTIVAQNVDGDLANGVSSQVMADTRVYFSAVYLPKATTLTGVKWYQVTAGSYTGDAYNGVGLYTYSGGTLTLVASSTNDANIWTATGGTIASKAFSSTYAASAGLYFVAYLYNNSAQTTAPVLGIVGGASTINTVTDFTNSAKTSSLLSSQTALPSPTQAMSGLTAAATEYKAFLY